MEAYNKVDLSSDQIEAMVTELEKINNFIVVYGAINADLVRKEELIEGLRSQETRTKAIKKINIEVERAVSLIADQTKLTLTKSSSDKDQFLYTALKQFNPKERFPCGLKGSVDERIKDCSYQLTSKNESFVLVARSEDFNEVYKELSTGLLWSDRLSNDMNQYDAEKVCKGDLKEVGGISDVSWRLPSIVEYLKAEESEIRFALPNIRRRWFWTSSIVSFNMAQLFSGYDGQVGNYYRYDKLSVQCVAQLDERM